MEIKKVLTIAGSDCSGGAGIQADLKTIGAFGCYGASVITSVVAENTSRVISVCNISADEVAKQIDAVFEDIEISAVKLGMLPSEEIITAVAEKLKQYGASHIVCDPVLVATSGDALSQNSVIPAYIKHLFPIAEVITPNIPEAEAFTGITIHSFEDIEAAAERLVQMGASGVLLKGGHTGGEKSEDYLLENGTPHIITGERIQSQNTHGTGCTLSSAVASGLAKGSTLLEAVENAKRYITLAIKNSYTVGKGHSPVNHYYELWQNCNNT